MTKSIGFIDSGVGGLTVMKEAIKQLPNESMIYLGDSKRCPYGVKTTEEVRQYTWEMVQFLLEKQVKMIVIACNTATAAALEYIKEKVDIPVIGVIQPGSIAAANQTKNKQIAILATKGTIESGLYQKLIIEKDQDIIVEGKACLDFASIVENGEMGSQKAEKIVHEALVPLAKQKFDTVVLGCTHYPLLRESIQEVFGDEVCLIDAGAETVQHLMVLLHYFNLAETFETNPHPKREYYTTGNPQIFQEITHKWLSDDIIVQKVDLTTYQQGEHNMTKELLIATKNKGKAKEFEAIFAPFGYQVKTLLDYPEISDVEETGTTFEENARLKAETIANELHTLVLADDSGLMVDALEGRPGVYSARFAGEPKSDAANNAKLLVELGGLEGKDRSAHFHTTLVLAAPGVDPLVAEGDVFGQIATFPSGTDGFGYDPLFYFSEAKQTFAEMGLEEKNKVSHRTNAIKDLLTKWEDWFQENKEILVTL
ncbi:glutamate racemase [Granulicatella balaenopterae]|uniref:Multifunctional fusion protein n=1 Tax=Granulicatella balaenopterae TaxID=137733 RepID=A0A1H9HNH7_9LACT|nr:glutamate racemase [Granulicatella balaenopterae]SEQ63873.1 glutamate racemase [Granulicatella balaenopterae]